MIVGAGPGGLALALQLAQRQLPVTLVESRAGIGSSFRGEALMPSGLAALEQLGLLPLEAAVPQRPLQGWSFWLERRPLFRVEEPMGSAHPCTLVEPEALLRSWVERLQRLPCARLQLGRSVAGLIHRTSGAATELLTPSRPPTPVGHWPGGRVAGVRLSDGQELQADLVVACDGRGSTLRRAAGLELAGASPAIDVLWFRLGGPAGATLAARLAGRFHTVIGSEGSMALFASASGGVQLGWPLQAGQRSERSPREWRQLWLRLSPPALAYALASVPLEVIEGPLRLPVRVGLAAPWWRPGLLLLGDAAHPMSPLRAQGTSMALRDVAAATALLPAALEQPAGPGREAAIDQALAALEARRRPEIVRMQALQEQEWQRGERLGHNPALRQLLAALAPGLAPLLAVVWRHSQEELRHGLAGALHPPTVPAAMMERASAAR